MPWKARFANRRWEWLFATYTILFGAQLARDGQAFNPVTLYLLLEQVSEPTWAAVYTIIGAAHCVALAINGMAWWTPYVRTLAASVNFLAYAIITLGIGAANNNSSGLPTYGYLVMGGLALIIFSAFEDAMRARAGRRRAD